MVIAQQSVKLLEPDPDEGIRLIKMCEFAARNCYASQEKMTADSCHTFIRSLITRGHEAPLEFGSLTFDITTSRAVLAEITRHRLASFCVESQRYIQEASTGQITFIQPEWYDRPAKEGDEQHAFMRKVWEASMENAENAYIILIAKGAKPEEAREVLPNSTACRIIMKANLREWRNIFKLRCSKAAYPQMRALALKMLSLADRSVPDVFTDLKEQYLSVKTND